MKLHLPSQSGVTVVENIFIDQYMPKANGEFVKLYLYLSAARLPKGTVSLVHCRCFRPYGGRCEAGLWLTGKNSIF